MRKFLERYRIGKLVQTEEKAVKQALIDLHAQSIAHEEFSNDETYHPLLGNNKNPEAVCGAVEKQWIFFFYFEIKDTTALQRDLHDWPADSHSIISFQELRQRIKVTDEALAMFLRLKYC